jgi:hypothetical protein
MKIEHLISGLLSENESVRLQAEWKLSQRFLVDQLGEGYYSNPNNRVEKTEEEKSNEAWEDFKISETPEGWEDYKETGWMDYCRRINQDALTYKYDEKNRTFSKVYLNFIKDFEVSPEKYVDLMEWQMVQEGILLKQWLKDEGREDDVSTDEEFDKAQSIVEKMTFEKGWDKIFTLPPTPI